MEILTFLSRHHPPPIDMKKAIHRVSRNVMWRMRTLVEGTDTGRDSLGKQSRRKRIIQPFIIFYSLAPGPYPGTPEHEEEAHKFHRRTISLTFQHTIPPSRGTETALACMSPPHGHPSGRNDVGHTP